MNPYHRWTYSKHKGSSASIVNMVPGRQKLAHMTPIHTNKMDRAINADASQVLNTDVKKVRELVFRHFPNTHGQSLDGGHHQVRKHVPQLGHCRLDRRTPFGQVHHSSVVAVWLFAAEIRKRRIHQVRDYSNWQWHLDEVFVRINGETHYLWRAVDHEGEVLESYVTKRRDRKAALKFLRKSMKRYGRTHVIVTDKLRSYGAAMKVIGNRERQETGRWLNNRAENSHLPFRRREVAMQRFRSMRSLQKFSSVHASVHNHFNQERHLYSRNNFKHQPHCRFE